MGIDAASDQPKDLVSLTVGVTRVLDLTDARRRRHFAITLETLIGDTEDDVESCRIVADLARPKGYDAILSPSAALDAASNLDVYIDGRADHLRLMDGPDRIPLNYLSRLRRARRPRRVGQWPCAFAKKGKEKRGCSPEPSVDEISLVEFLRNSPLADAIAAGELSPDAFERERELPCERCLFDDDPPER